jgi:hypothetical protein
MLVTALQFALASEHVGYLVGSLDWIWITPAEISTVWKDLRGIFQCERPVIGRDLELPRRNNDMAVNEGRHGLDRWHVVDQ